MTNTHTLAHSAHKHAHERFVSVARIQNGDRDGDDAKNCVFGMVVFGWAFVRCGDEKWVGLGGGFVRGNYSSFWIRHARTCRGRKGCRKT